jgi:hypothetical protein
LVSCARKSLPILVWRMKISTSSPLVVEPIYSSFHRFAVDGSSTQTPDMREMQFMVFSYCYFYGVYAVRRGLLSFHNKRFHFALKWFQIKGRRLNIHLPGMTTQREINSFEGSSFDRSLVLARTSWLDIIISF